MADISIAEDDVHRADIVALLLDRAIDEAAARRLYARRGFTEVGPFGDYAPGTEHIFLRLPLEHAGSQGTMAPEVPEVPEVPPAAWR